MLTATDNAATADTCFILRTCVSCAAATSSFDSAAAHAVLRNSYGFTYVYR
jgi:hypothetical protein